MIQCATEVKAMRHVSVRMDDELYKKLEKEAKALKLPKSWIIRRALEHYLAKLARKDRVELAFALAEEVEPTEEEKRLVEEFRKKPHKFISQEEIEKELGL